MGVRTLVTFQRFEQYPDDGRKHELIRGEHIVVPPPKLRHTLVQQRLQDALRPYVHANQLGEVYIEAGFKLSSDNFLQPDISFVSVSQLKSTHPDGYLEGAPVLAIEVLSESNTPAKIARKIELYFEHGSKAVWVVDPTRREVRVHSRNGMVETAGGSAQLQSELLPGWSAFVPALFSEQQYR